MSKILNIRMMLYELPVLGRPSIWITVGQGPTAVAVGADGVSLDIFTLIYPFCPLSPSLWETARDKLKYCLKEPLIKFSYSFFHIRTSHKHIRIRFRRIMKNI